MHEVQGRRFWQGEQRVPHAWRAQIDEEWLQVTGPQTFNPRTEERQDQLQMAVEVIRKAKGWLRVQHPDLGDDEVNLVVRDALHCVLVSPQSLERSYRRMMGMIYRGRKDREGV